MENLLPFTDDVMVVLVHKCVQQTHLLALHLETLGYIPSLLNKPFLLLYCRLLMYTKSSTNHFGRAFDL